MWKLLKDGKPIAECEMTGGSVTIRCYKPDGTLSEDSLKLRFKDYRGIVKTFRLEELECSTTT